MSLRRGKTKTILQNSIDSALLAVEIYNKPRTRFRAENYIMLMIVAWTKLFHAYYQNAIGEKYFYKKKNGRYMIVDGERKAWELSECLKHYNKLSSAVLANLNFFIKLRNKIEHRYLNSSTLNIMTFGECQSLLYNYENFLVTCFGEEYSINECLSYSLQFSQIRTKEQIRSQKDLLSKEVIDIKKYIEKYRSELNQEVFDSNEYSIKLIQIPKISNTNRNDLAVEFVNWNSINDDDKQKYEKLTVLIKDKVVKQKVSNLNLIKPSDVINKVKKKSDIEINMSEHTLLWKSFGVRPGAKCNDKFDTIDEYCIYDEPHNDYLYTDKWVDFIVTLFTKYKFTNENIKQKCNKSLNPKDFK